MDRHSGFNPSTDGTDLVSPHSARLIDDRRRPRSDFGMFMETNSGRHKAASKAMKTQRNWLHQSQKDCFSADNVTAVSVYTFLLPLTLL